MSDGEAPYRPATVLWMVADGPILAGRPIDRNADATEEAVAAFEEAMHNPWRGPRTCRRE